MELGPLYWKLRQLAEKTFGPARGDWEFGEVRIGEFGPCTLYLPDERMIDIQLSRRAENDTIQALYQLAHEVCHTLHPSRDALTLSADDTSVLNEGIATWFSCFVCDHFGYGESARASTAKTPYGKPMDLVSELMRIDSESIKKLRAFQPHIDRLEVGDFAEAGVEIPPDLAQALVRSFKGSGN